MNPKITHSNYFTIIYTPNCNYVFTDVTVFVGINCKIMKNDNQIVFILKLAKQKISTILQDSQCHCQIH